MPDNYERFVRWYLRFNGYFTIENFIIHNPHRISDGVVSNHTESDILAVRMPYSKEIVGQLQIANHEPLTYGADGRHDLAIVEVKSKKDNQPNDAWKLDQESPPDRFKPIEYTLRFFGLHREDQLPIIASKLGMNHSYEDASCRIRSIVFSKRPNRHFQNRGTTYITFGQIIEFLAIVRGECWVNSGIGVASIHNQWEPLIDKAFAIFNGGETLHERQRQALRLLDEFGIQSSPIPALSTSSPSSI
jgi:hypothetical protein